MEPLETQIHKPLNVVWRQPSQTEYIFKNGSFMIVLGKSMVCNIRHCRDLQGRVLTCSWKSIKITSMIESQSLTTLRQLETIGILLNLFSRIRIWLTIPQAKYDRKILKLQGLPDVKENY